MFCADGRYRRCFPILSNILADYEEQVLITGIKSGRQCPNCVIPPDERENLCSKWPTRTHKDMQTQIAKQKRQKISPRDDSWVHDIDNFAWHHSYINIYDSMSIDLLHQLHKGVIKNLIDWVSDLIGDLYHGISKKKNGKRKLKELPGAIQLDTRFRAIP